MTIITALFTFAAMTILTGFIWLLILGSAFNRG